MPSLGNTNNIDILINSEANTEGVTKTEESLGGLGGKTKELIGSVGDMTKAFVFGNIIFSTTTIVADKLRGAFDDALQASKDWQTQQAILAGQLSLSGTAAGITKDSMLELAESTQKNTAVSREAALAGINQLLTFQEIGKDVLPQAEDAVTRLASSMASGAIPNTQQMTESAKALGIALDDPSKGYTRLHRNGVDFTADQVNQIKQLQASGDMFGAQQIILKGVSDHYASLSAQSGTWAFQTARLRETFNDFINNSLKTLKQVLMDVFNWWNNNKQKIEDTAQAVIGFLKPSFDALMNTLSGMMPTLKTLYNDVLKPLAEILGVAIVIAVWLFINVLNVLLQVLRDVVQWGKDVGDAFVTAYYDINHAWQDAIGFFENIGSNIVNFMRNSWNTIRNDVKQLINDIVNFFATLPDRAVHAIGDLGSRIGNDIKGALHAIHIPGFATGMQNFGGGLAWVGENGPELVNLPRGSAVYTNSQSQSMAQPSGSNYYFTGNIILGSAGAVNEFFKQINQDGILASKGLTVRQGV